MMRHLLVRFGLCLAVAGAAAGAQAFPTKPLTIVVPFAAGGTADQLARVFADGLGRDLGQNVVVENRPGAANMIGARAVANAAPDGHTLLLNSNSTLVLTPMLYRSIPYEPADLMPLVLAVEAPLVLVGSAKLPAEDFPAFVDYARKPGQQTSYASIGPGNLMQLANLVLNESAGIEPVHVPYNGKIEAAMTSVIAGDNDILMNVVSHALPFIRSGMVTALGVATAERLPMLEQVPTFEELGYPGFRAATSFGLAIHADTDPAIVERLRDSAHKIMARPDFRQRFEEQGLIVQPARDAEALQAHYENERRQWSAVVREHNIRLD